MRFRLRNMIDEVEILIVVLNVDGMNIGVRGLCNSDKSKEAVSYLQAVWIRWTERLKDRNRRKNRFHFPPSTFPKAHIPPFLSFFFFLSPKLERE